MSDHALYRVSSQMEVAKELILKLDKMMKLVNYTKLMETVPIMRENTFEY